MKVRQQAKNHRLLIDDQSLSISITSGEGARLLPLKVWPDPPHELFTVGLFVIGGAVASDEVGREVGREDEAEFDCGRRGARPESVFPEPENDGGCYTKARKKNR